MNENSTPAGPEVIDSDREVSSPEADVDPRGNPVRRTTLVVLVICVLLFFWYLLADRFAPWTDQGRVQAFVVPISFKVSGRVTKVHVKQDQQVQAGDVLAEIRPVDYELTLKEAEAALEQATQNIGASVEQVTAAKAKVEKSRAELAYVEKQAERYIKLAAKGVVAKADEERARAEVKKAQATLKNAEADLDKAKQRLGDEGENNPKIQQARAAVEQARVNLAATKLRAPSNGGVTNLLVHEGEFANAGSPLMTFVSFDEVWIQANLRENSLGHLQIGGEVEIALDSAPGQVFPGKVSSIGFAVEQPSTGKPGELVVIKSSSSWLRDAQRFPVTIHFSDGVPRGLVRVGGQADVQFYTEGSTLLNGLGRLWLRLMSLFSYVH